jgi:RES domain-containing protein
VPTFDPARLDRVAPTTFRGIGYRHQAPGFDPRSGEGARRFGGRFNPHHSFPVIYLCTTRDCAVAELTKQAERQNIELSDLLPRELWSVELALERVLDLCGRPALASLELTAADLVLPDHAFTQAIGEAAHDRGFEAIWSRSATGVDDVITVLLDNLGSRPINVEMTERWRTLDDLT